MINKLYKAGGTFKTGVLPNSFPTKTEYRFLLGAVLWWKSNIGNP